MLFEREDIFGKFLMRGNEVKKWLLFSFFIVVLFLAACSEGVEDSNQLVENENEQGESNGGEREQDDNIEELQVEAHIMAAYTLQELVRDYGYVPDLTEFYISNYEFGVVYAELVDFNQDGADELFVIVKGSSYLPSSLDYRETDGYFIEIWGTSGESYLPIYSRNVAMDECSACDLSVGLIEFKDGTYGYYESTAQTAQGTTVSEETIYFIGSTFNFETTVFKSGTGGYEIDGESIAEEAFTAQRELYNGNVKPIIESNFGTKSFVFDGDSSAGIVANIYDQVAYAFDDIAEFGTEVEPWTVQAESERVLNLFDVRTDSPDYFDRMVEYVILYEDVEADLPSHDIFLVVSESTIADKVEDVFGVALDTSKLTLPKPSEDIINHLVAYEDGAFYIVPTGFSMTTIIRTVEKAWEVADDTYYMIVSDIEFDEFAYYNVNEDASYEEIDSFLYEPIETWPIEARKWAVSDVRRYLLVQMVDGRATIKFIGGYPLSIEEIQGF